MTERTDAELLADHVAGDAEAFGELFARHRDRLWAVALRTMGNPDDAHWSDPRWIVDKLRDPQLAKAVEAMQTRIASGDWPKSWIETGCSSGWIRSSSFMVFSLP